MGPDELGRYRLRRVLGRAEPGGGISGETWEATVAEPDAGDARDRVALKIVRVDDESMDFVSAHLASAARRLATVRHPNLARLLEHGSAGGTTVIVTNFVAGRTLAAHLADGSVPSASATRWLAEIAAALEAMHAVGVVHAAVKASSVVITERGRAWLVGLGVPPREATFEACLEADQAAWGALGETLLAETGTLEARAVLARAAGRTAEAPFTTMAELGRAWAVACPGVSSARRGSPIHGFLRMLGLLQRRHLD